MLDYRSKRTSKGANDIDYNWVDTQIKINIEFCSRNAWFAVYVYVWVCFRRWQDSANRHDMSTENVDLKIDFPDSNGN